MERSVALKKLRKILGDKLRYRVDPKAPTPEERAAAKAELNGAIAERNRLREEKEARYQTILAQDSAYQRFLAECREASKRVDRLWSITRHYKITVGIKTSENYTGMFFFEEVEGDSWEEILEKLNQKTVAEIPEPSHTD